MHYTMHNIISASFCDKPHEFIEGSYFKPFSVTVPFVCSGVILLLQKKKKKTCK